MLDRNYLCFERNKNDRQTFYDTVQNSDPDLKDKLGNIDFGYDIDKRPMRVRYSL